MKLKTRDGETVVDPYSGLPVVGVIDTDTLQGEAKFSLLRLHHQGDLIEAVDPPAPAAKKAGGEK